MPRIALLSILALGACTRVGFSPGGDATALVGGGADFKTGSSDGRVPGDSGGEGEGDGATAALDAGPGETDAGAGLLADRCEGALPIDLAQGPLALTLDTSQAANDYAIPCCEGKPELILRLEPAPASLSLVCTGGPAVLHLARGPALGTCPPSPDANCAAFSCTGVTATFQLPPGTAYIALCREAQAPPATITLTTPR